MDVDEIAHKIMDCYGADEWHSICRKKPYELVTAILTTYKGILDVEGLKDMEEEDMSDTKYKKKIVLEIGHGDHPDGFEVGAVDAITGTREWDMNKVCAQFCKDTLEEMGYVDVSVTDLNDYLGNIGKRYDDCAVFVSVHHNAFSDSRAQGSEALIHSSHWSPNDEKLAEILAFEMAKDLGIKNRGIKTMSLSVLKGAMSGDAKTGNAVCLIEPYFITGKDVDNHEQWSAKAGKAVAKGIDIFLEEK